MIGLSQTLWDRALQQATPPLCKYIKHYTDGIYQIILQKLKIVNELMQFEISSFFEDKIGFAVILA